MAKDTGENRKPKGGSPYSEQRCEADGKDRSGPEMSHGEHPAMKGSLRTAQKHLERQDSLGEYELSDTAP